MIYLLIDTIGTLVVLAAARRNPVLKARLDYAFGRLIKRPIPVYRDEPRDEEDDSVCPFCE